MFKKILTLCFISILTLSLIGCSKENTTAVDNQKTIDQSKNPTIKEADQNSSTKTDENASNKKTSDISNKAESLADYFKQKDKILLAGKINNNLNIHMELKITNKKQLDDPGIVNWNPAASMEGLSPETRYEGFYYYDKYLKHIKVEAERYSNGYFVIYEFDENNNFCNSFGGFLEDENVLKGTWTNHKGSIYEFYLVKDGTSLQGINLNSDTNKLGDYYTLESHKGDFTCLYIVAISDKQFKFHISGYSKPNIGEVGGIAYYTDNSKKQAVFKDEENKAQINFSFEDKTIKVSISGNNNYAGAHVKMEGTFKKNESKENLSEIYLGDD